MSVSDQATAEELSSVAEQPSSISLREGAESVGESTLFRAKQQSRAAQQQLAREREREIFFGIECRGRCECALSETANERY